MVDIMKYPQRVHIIPIGDDEIDRIIIPAEKGKADRHQCRTSREENPCLNYQNDSQRRRLRKRQAGRQVSLL